MNSIEVKRNSEQRPKKRRYYGNQHSKQHCVDNALKESSPVSRNPEVSSTPEPVRISASRKKLGLKSSSVPFTSTFEGNSIFDKELFLSISDKRVAGLSSLISITCSSCKIQVSTRNSKLLGPKKNIPKINRINLRHS
ncbi:hypothetical protein AVEN_184-1 [Araneus ventricosus]|uniref:Uncharacterized protein n=1 Tax=Araneus ventricosus TaxID=182803 RepID=A0A4Y2D221_ARAVE|nr:hypothetical protein AVEN_184-1 [Araneus ventricosus]